MTCIDCGKETRTPSSQRCGKCHILRLRRERWEAVGKRESVRPQLAKARRLANEQNRDRLVQAFEQSKG